MLILSHMLRPILSVFESWNGNSRAWMWICSLLLDGFEHWDTCKTEQCGNFNSWYALWIFPLLIAALLFHTTDHRYHLSKQKFLCRVLLIVINMVIKEEGMISSASVLISVHGPKAILVRIPGTLLRTLSSTVTAVARDRGYGSLCYHATTAIAREQTYPLLLNNFIYFCFHTSTKFYFKRLLLIVFYKNIFTNDLGDACITYLRSRNSNMQNNVIMKPVFKIEVK